MNRRGFLQFLGLGAAVQMLDPERLLWAPGQKTIFLPPVVTTMSGLDAINTITLKYITPGLLDSIWRQDSFLHYLQDSQIAFNSDRILREPLFYGQR